MKQDTKRSLRAVGRVLVTLGAMGVGVLTMPIWPFLLAAMVWNDLGEDEAE